jgi:DNA-binding MarR family transcriptional regulator
MRQPPVAPTAGAPCAAEGPISLPDRHATLGALLRRPYEDMSRWLYAELSAAGFDEVRPAYSSVLRNLPPEGSRVSELAVRAGMTKQSMAYLVEQMADAGLVAVRADPTDGRAKRVRFTARGSDAVAAALQLSARYERALGKRLGASKLKQLRVLLTELQTFGGEPPR